MKINTNSPLLEYTATSSYATLQKATNAMCEHRSKQGNAGVTFSMFETSKKDNGIDSDDWIVDHPDIWSSKPVFEGNCVFFSDYWRIADDKVFSEVMVNPTWRDIINESGRQLIDPEDGSCACLFLEGFRECDEKSSEGNRYFELIWGS